MPFHYFTLDEANALLETLRPLMRDILDARKQIVDAQPELWPVLEKSVGNGGSKKAGAMLKHFEVIQSGVKTLEGLGVEVKDLNMGLVDFPARRDGRDVYLCWRYNEAQVTFWHELDAGYAGRQPL
jgi:hypothetical protein